MYYMSVHNIALTAKQLHNDAVVERRSSNPVIHIAMNVSSAKLSDDLIIL